LRGGVVAVDLRELLISRTRVGRRGGDEYEQDQDEPRHRSQIIPRGRAKRCGVHCWRPSIAESRMAAARPSRRSKRQPVSGEKSTVSLRTNGLKFCRNIATCPAPASSA